MSNRVLIDQSNNTVTTDTTSTQNNVILSPDNPDVVTVVENTSNIITIVAPGPRGIGGATGSQGPAGTDFYTTDGVLTGNRIVNAGGFSLTLNPILKFSESITGITDKKITNNFAGTATTTRKSSVAIDNFTTQDGSIFYSANSLYTKDYGTNTGALGSGLVSISSFNYNVSLRGLTPAALIQSRNYVQQIRDDASDVSTSTNNAFEGVGVYQSHWQTAGSTISTGVFYGFNHATNIRSGTLVNNYSHRSIIDIGRFTSNVTLVTNHYAFISEGIVGTSSGPSATITNYYGLFLNTPSVGVTGTITNRWGVYAPDSSMKHYLNGNLSLGTSETGSNKLLVVGSTKLNGNVDVTGSISVSQNISASNAIFTGNITAQTLIVQTVTSSIVYSSGSNIFGNDLSNTQTLTGSVSITGSLTIAGSVNASNITGSLFGTASWAENSITASYALNAGGAGSSVASNLYLFFNY